MKYSFLGDTGLLVSKLSFGSWVTFNNTLDFDKAYEIMEHAYKAGINFFDNAEAYANGKSEIVMGKVIAAGIERQLWERSDLVLSTKIFFGTTDNSKPNDIGLSRKHIIEGTKASLKRMGIEYVDLIFCHRRDPFTPIEEVVRAMNFVINQGWAFYWGTSEWSALDIIEACEIADRLNLIRPIMDQPEYNMLERSRVEYEYAPIYQKYKYGLTTWSPLASGLLTGKYSNGIPKGSRLDTPKMRSMVTEFDSKVKVAQNLTSVADKLGCSVAQLAIAWAAKNKNVSTVILGASSIKQLDENLKALDYIDKFTPEICEEIDAIINFKPKTGVSFSQSIVNMRSKFL